MVPPLRDHQYIDHQYITLKERYWTLIIFGLSQSEMGLGSLKTRPYDADQHRTDRLLNEIMRVEVKFQS